MARRLFLIWLAGLTGFVIFAVFGLRPVPSEADYRRLDADIAAYMSERWERGPVLGGGVEGEAFEHYVEALRGVTTWERDEQALCAQLIDGARCGTVGPMPRSLGPVPRRVPQPHRFGTYAYDFSHLALNDAKRGHPAEAVDLLLALHQLGVDTAEGGNLGGWLAGIYAARRALIRMGEAVVSGNLPPAQVERIRAFLRANPDWPRPDRRNFRAEMLSLRKNLVEELWPQDEPAPFAELLGRELGIRRGLGSMGCEAYFRTRSLLSELAAAVEGGSDPWPEVCRLGGRAPLESELRHTATAWPRAIVATYWYHVTAEGVRLGIDLWRQRERTGKLPADLPAGWTLKPTPDKSELGLYPRDAGPDEWVFTLPARK